MGNIVEILIAPSATAEMASKASVRAEPGRGLAGDRYFLGVGTFSPSPRKPDYEVTLIELENVEAFAAQSGLPFNARHARRNIVTKDVRLNDLIGREFFVGAVRLRGVRLCEPCKHLAELSFPEALTGLVRKGGLRAQILTAGEIRVGEAVRVV